MNKKRAVMLAAAAVILLPLAAAAQQFSADQVSRDNSGQIHKGKVYFANGKLRLEPAKGGRPNEPDFILSDLSAQVEDMVFLAQHTYIERSGPIVQQDTKYFQVGNPCQRNTGSADAGTCKKLGAETVNGRTTERWEVAQTVRGQTVTAYLWIDPRLNAIVREQALGFDIQLENIKEGSQPASLFQLPAGYRKIVIPNRPRRASH